MDPASWRGPCLKRAFIVKTVLITGAAGVVAGYIREQLRGQYALRLSDITPITELGEGESFVSADVRDMGQLLAAAQGVDAIIHLGAIPVEDDWEPILEANIVGTYNLYEAARQAAVPRVIFASSITRWVFIAANRRSL